MRCPYCNGESSGKFCSYCGSELPKNKTIVHIEHNESTVNNYGLKDNVENIIEFAHMEMNLKNYQNAYSLLCKALENNPRNWKAVSYREVCNYFLYGNFEKAKAVYLACITECKDEKTVDNCKCEFADVLIDYSYNANDVHKCEVVFDLAETLINTSGLDVIEYLKSFKNDVLEFKKVNKWNLNFKERKKVNAIIDSYDKLLLSIK